MTSPQLKKVTDDIEDALERVGKRMSQTLKNRTDAQREQLRRIVRETRERDKAYRHQEQNVRRPINPYEQTGFGSNTTRRYRDEFFADRRNRNSNAHVIHHAIEQQVLRRYRNMRPPITAAEMNSSQNLRGIPEHLNGDVHLSGIRRMWNQFYKHYDDSNTTPTRQDLLDFANLVDDAFGDLFDPPVR